MPKELKQYIKNSNETKQDLLDTLEQNLTAILDANNGIYANIPVSIRVNQGDRNSHRLFSGPRMIEQFSKYITEELQTPIKSYDIKFETNYGFSKGFDVINNSNDLIPVKGSIRDDTRLGNLYRGTNYYIVKDGAEITKVELPRTGLNFDDFYHVLEEYDTEKYIYIGKEEFKSIGEFRYKETPLAIFKNPMNVTRLQINVEIRYWLYRNREQRAAVAMRKALLKEYEPDNKTIKD